MIPQPVPEVTAADVERVVRRDYPAQRVAEVLALLGEYGKETWHREPHRVYLAVLKLAGGNLKRLRSQLEVARCDYRDVLAAAEYPGYARHIPGPDQPSAEKTRQIIEADWREYQQWLNR